MSHLIPVEQVTFVLTSVDRLDSSAERKLPVGRRPASLSGAVVTGVSRNPSGDQKEASPASDPDAHLDTDATGKLGLASVSAQVHLCGKRWCCDLVQIHRRWPRRWTEEPEPAGPPSRRYHANAKKSFHLLFGFPEKKTLFNFLL